MGEFQKYVILTAFKEFVKDLSDVYDEDGDEPTCVFKAYLDNMTIFSDSCEKTITELNKFFVKNKFVFDSTSSPSLETHPLEIHTIKFDDDAYIDVYRYLSKEDENTPIIYAHLKALDHLIKGGSTNEERFLEDFVAGFKNTFSAPENSGGDGLENESFEQISDAIKPSVERSLSTFKQQNLNVDRFLKLICLKVKDHLNKNALPTEDIKKEDLIEILDLAIENDVEELLQLKFQIMAMLSKSGLLARLPFDKILQMASSYNENAPQNAGVSEELLSLTNFETDN